MAKQRKTVYQKEMLDEKLKKIDEVFKMGSEIYRNGPTKGLSGISEGTNLTTETEEWIQLGENQLTLPIPYVFYLKETSTEQQKNQQLTRGIDFCVDLWVGGGL